MKCRYYLMLGSEKVDISSSDCLDVSNMIANLSDISLSYSRVDLGGVVRKCGSTIEFVSIARERLVEHFLLNGLSSKASFAVYQIENDWTYTELFQCPLDFSSFSHDIYRASVGCLDSSAAALIKANKSTEYEYPVSELKENAMLRYDGVKIFSEAEFQIMADTVEDQSYMQVEFAKDVWWWIPRIATITTGEVEGKSFLFSENEESFQTDGSDCGWGFPANNNNTSYFVECLVDNYITVNFSDFHFVNSRNLGFVLFKITTGGGLEPLTCGYSNLLSLDSNTRTTAVKWTGKMLAGEKLQYAVFNHDRISDLYGKTIRVYPYNGKVTWHDNAEAISIDVISPSRLLDKLLESISSGHERIYGMIKTTALSPESHAEVSNDRLKNIMLVAAESIRNFDNARVYTSFDKFCKFMETVFGYVYEIQERSSSQNNVIENNSFPFGGFTELETNTTYVDSENTVIMFSTTDGTFVGVVGDGGMGNVSSKFPGSEEYQDRYDTEEAQGYRVFTDRYFLDTSLDIYYIAKIDKKYNSVDYVWFATLEEAVVDDIYQSDYNGIREFGGFIDSVVSDSGSYSGTFSASSVYYSRRNKQFYYKSGSAYYSSFPDSGVYNAGDRARLDIIFLHEGQYYVVVGTAMTKCTLSSVEISNKNAYIVFRHRDELFGTGVGKLIGNIADAEYSVASQRIYSSVQLGYEKKEYDLGNNGNDEFNFNVTYTTGLSLTETKLSLMSPYRADCYGFEELARKRGEDTSSSDSDNQTFIVSCVRSGTEYLINREVPIGGVYSDSVFNAELSVPYIIKANERYLASFATELKFASMEGNSDAVIGSDAINEDIALTNPLLGFGNIRFSTDNYILPSDWNNTAISVDIDGRTYTGCLSNIDISARESEKLDYELIEIR